MPVCCHVFQSSTVLMHKAARGPSFGDQKLKDPHLTSALGQQHLGAGAGGQKPSAGRGVAGNTAVTETSARGEQRGLVGARHPCPHVSPVHSKCTLAISARRGPLGDRRQEPPTGGWLGSRSMEAKPSSPVVRSVMCRVNV